MRKVGAQNSLPDGKLNANRDIDGYRKAILDAVLQAQGKGCGPGILGACIGGDRATGHEMSEEQFLRQITDRNHNPDLDKLEQDILKTANELGIGPMGFGGKTMLLGVKICAANASQITKMCEDFRAAKRTYSQNPDVVGSGLISSRVFDKTEPQVECLLAKGKKQSREALPKGNHLPPLVIVSLL